MFPNYPIPQQQYPPTPSPFSPLVGNASRVNINYNINSNNRQFNASNGYNPAMDPAQQYIQDQLARSNLRVGFNNGFNTHDPYNVGVAGQFINYKGVMENRCIPVNDYIAMCKAPDKINDFNTIINEFRNMCKNVGDKGSIIGYIPMVFGQLIPDKVPVDTVEFSNYIIGLVTNGEYPESGLDYKPTDSHLSAEASEVTVMDDSFMYINYDIVKDEDIRIDNFKSYESKHDSKFTKLLVPIDDSYKIFKGECEYNRFETGSEYKSIIEWRGEVVNPLLTINIPSVMALRSMDNHIQSAVYHAIKMVKVGCVRKDGSRLVDTINVVIEIVSQDQDTIVKSNVVGGFESRVKMKIYTRIDINDLK